MNTTSLNFSRCRRRWPCALLLLGLFLSGCGGGGGSTPSTTTLTQTAKITLSGTLLNSAGAPLVGYKVVYSPAAAAHLRHAENTGDTISAVTNSQGQYSLSIPVSDAAQAATLSVYDTTGTQVQSQSITLDPSQPVQTTVTTVTPTSTTTTPPVTSGPGAPPAPPTPPI